MKKEHISAIYAAKRLIEQNKRKMLDHMRMNDLYSLRQLREENERIRERIKRLFGIMID